MASFFLFVINFLGVLALFDHIAGTEYKGADK